MARKEREAGMNLRLAQQPVAGRRLGGLALSVPLHLVMLMIAAYGIVGLPPVQTTLKPEVQVTYVSRAPTPAMPREPMLVDQAELFTDIPKDSASLSLPDFEFNIMKVDKRRTCSSRSSRPT